MNLKSIYESIIFEGNHWSETIVEDKTSLIKNRLVLPDIEDPDEKEKFKATLIGFFKRHPNYENKIDWNKAKTLTKADFDEVLSLEGTLSGKENAASTEKNILDIFKSVKGRKFEIVGENSRWLFVAPLNWKAAVYCDSSENQGAGAKWCIGYEESSSYWHNYISNGSIFVMAFNKSYREMSKEELQSNLKYMIQRDEYGRYHLWTQEDDDKGEDLDVVGENVAVAEKMFSKAKSAFDAIKAELENRTNKKVSETLAGLKEITSKTIDPEIKSLVTKIDIPDSVTRIGEKAFTYCGGLTSITIPDSVTSIGDYAFAYCTNLTSITIPDSVTSIGEFAFTGCFDLTSITIPDSVTSIGKSAIVNPNTVVTISKNFNKKLLKKANLPKTAKIRVVE